MMYKRNFIIYALIIASIIFTSKVNIVYGNNNDKRTLIVYEAEKVIGYDENIVNHLNELLYVFNEKVDKTQIGNYKKGDIDNYDYVFVINIYSEINNKIFLEDIYKTNKKIYWIGDNVESIIDYKPKYLMKYKGKTNNILSLSYNNMDIKINNADSYNIILPSKDTKILATMNNGHNEYPFIVREENLYYISNWDMYQSYIFEDTLNDFFDKVKFKKGEIFVRIEDVHPFRDTKRLRAIADYLYEEDVPFIIALIPTYMDFHTKRLNTLNEKEEFINTIRYMQEKGGSVILHGYTHQIGTEEVSGEGFEFFDVKDGKPIDEDITKYVKDRVLSGLRLCIENDIYPIGFEAPHYAMNEDGYREIKKYFSTYVGQYQNNNDKFATSTFPYIIKDSKNFNILIPENLGYIEEGDVLAVEKIKEEYYKLSMVRGYSGGFFFHPYLDINYLKECIRYFKSKDVNFIDLKNEYNYIKIDDIKIESHKGNVLASYDKSKSINKNNIDNAFSNNIKNINTIVIKFVSAVLAIFIIIFIIFTYMNRQKFMRSKK